jgi:Methyltransferase domain
VKREVRPELLDHLPPADPRAIHSRKDLQRVNAWMRNARIMARELGSCLNGKTEVGLVEIGAGDGSFLLKVGALLAGSCSHATAVLLDKNNIVTPETRSRFLKIGWKIETVTSDVNDWLQNTDGAPCDFMIANLFLHHFSDPQLGSLLSRAAQHTKVFIAVEPRRWGWSLIFARFLWMIGCNRVTQHDALVSIRAGFANQELSNLWPSTGSWLLREHPANLSSHLFVAKRRNTD